MLVAAYSRVVMVDLAEVGSRESALCSDLIRL